MNDICDVNRESRVWLDGCFDLLHYGHANSMRQAKEMGEELVVGIHNDREILYNKGIFVMKEEERYELVESMRYSSEFVHDAIFCPTLQSLIENNCEFATHGDDLTITSSGVDVYAQVNNANKLRLFKRTEGISTTAIIDRILHPEDLVQNMSCPNMRLLPLFQKNMREPQEFDKVIYMAGDFDLFHPGHLNAIKQAASLGTHLTIGIYSDDSVETVTGRRPILSTYERAMIVMACKFVDKVMIDVNIQITEDFMKDNAIEVVMDNPTLSLKCCPSKDYYKIAEKRGLVVLHDAPTFTKDLIINRIWNRR